MPPLTHAKLGASSAHRWMSCPGSVALEQSVPESAGDDSPHAQEGTAAHALAEMCVLKDVKPELYLGTTIKGWQVDDEMVESVELFLNEIDRIKSLDPGSRVVVEARVSLESLGPPEPMYGTCDVLIWQPTAKRLYVLDFKYGQGVVVNVQDNPQLQYYALGAWLNIESLYDDVSMPEEIAIVIVQPRAYHTDGPIRRQWLRPEDLVAFGVDLLQAAESATAEAAPRIPGSHCRFCRAKAVCPEVHDRAQEIAQVEFSEMPIERPPAPESLSLQQIASLLDKVDIIEEWIKSLRDHAKAALERGDSVPGFKLVPKRAVRKWKDESAVRKYMHECGFSENEIHDLKLKSVAQMEKLLKKAEIELDAELYDKKSSGTTLAPSDDPRPEANVGPDADFAALPAK